MKSLFELGRFRRCGECRMGEFLGRWRVGDPLLNGLYDILHEPHK